MRSDSELRTYASDTENWLPAPLADSIVSVLPSLAEDIIGAIQREVAAYARPLAGDFGTGIRTGTELALRHFIGSGDVGSMAVYRSLGRGEHRAGRTLDSLQAAYRVGARVAWRRISELAADAGADAELQRRLAERMFSYIEQLAAESVEGYSEAQLEQAGELQRQRRDLFAMLLAERPYEQGAIRLAADRAAWLLPSVVACVVVAADRAGPLRRRLTGDALEGEMEGRACLLVPEPLRLPREARRAVRELRAPVALGPVVAPSEAHRSWRWARLACELESGRPELIVAEERAAELALLAAGEVMPWLGARALDPLAGETPRSRARLEDTLRCWLRHRGSQKAIARELSVHPQTVRYRLGRLRDIFGGALDDPDTRFELELALRARSLPAGGVSAAVR